MSSPFGVAPWSRHVRFSGGAVSGALERPDLFAGRRPRPGLHVLHVHGPDADLRGDGADAQGVSPHLYSSAFHEIFVPVIRSRIIRPEKNPVDPLSRQVLRETPVARDRRHAARACGRGPRRPHLDRRPGVARVSAGQRDDVAGGRHRRAGGGRIATGVGQSKQGGPPFFLFFRKAARRSRTS